LFREFGSPVVESTIAVFTASENCVAAVVFTVMTALAPALIDVKVQVSTPPTGAGQTPPTPPLIDAETNVTCRGIVSVTVIPVAAEVRLLFLTVIV
jgi:hypothetical protein